MDGKYHIWFRIAEMGGVPSKGSLGGEYANVRLASFHPRPYFESYLRKIFHTRFELRSYHIFVLNV